MVNRLLTVSIKVNIPHLPNRRKDRDAIMKKNTPARWSFWNWLLGSGTDNAGGGNA